MRFDTYLKEAKKPFITFEVLPPKRGGIGHFLADLERLKEYKPPFINVTSNPSEVLYTGRTSRTRKKRPGTLGICSLIQHDFGIEAVPHVLGGFTVDETEDFLIDIDYLGMSNVLAIQGDHPPHQLGKKDGWKTNKYSIDVVKQIMEMNKGIYLDGEGDKTNFCVAVGGYPEKHWNDDTLLDSTMYTQHKLSIGASYIITQMFFSNLHYYSFKEHFAEQGMIIPGVKILTSRKQLMNIPEMFNATIPDELSHQIRSSSHSEVPDIGIQFAYNQIENLILDKGAKAVHIFVVNDAPFVCELMDALDDLSEIEFQNFS